MPYRHIPDRSTALALHALVVAGLLNARVRTWNARPRVYAVDGGEDVVPWLTEMPIVGVPQGTRAVQPNMADVMAFFRLEPQGWSWGKEAFIVVHDAAEAVRLLKRHLDDGVMDLAIGVLDNGETCLHVGAPRIDFRNDYAALETYWKADTTSPFWYVRDGYSIRPTILVRLVPKNVSGHVLLGSEGSGRWINPDWTSIKDVLMVEASGEQRNDVESDWEIRIPLRLVPIRQEREPSLWIVPDGNAIYDVFQTHAIQDWDRFAFWSIDGKVIISRLGDERVIEIEESLSAISDCYVHLGNDWYVPAGTRLQPPVPVQTLERILVLGTDSLPVVVDPWELYILQPTEERNVSLRRLRRDASMGVVDILKIRLIAEFSGTDPVAETGLDTWKRDLPLEIPLVEDASSPRAAVKTTVEPNGGDLSDSAGLQENDNEVEDAPEGEDLAAHQSEDTEFAMREASPPQDGLRTSFEQFVELWNAADDESKDRIRAIRSGETAEHGRRKMTGDDWALFSIHLYEEGEIDLSMVAWAHWVAGQRKDEWALIGEHLELKKNSIRDILEHAPYEEARQRMIADGVPAEVAYLVLSSTALRTGSGENWRLSQELLIRDYVRGVGHAFARFAVERAETRRVTRTGSVETVIASLQQLGSRNDPRIRASVALQGMLIAKKHLSDDISSDAFHDSDDSLDSVADLSGDAIWSSFLAILRGNPPSEEDSSITMWQTVIEARPLREGKSSTIGPIELFERRPPESLVQRLYEERIVEVLTRAGSSRSEVFPSESTVIQQVMNTTLLRDIVEIVGTNEMLLPLIPVVPDHGPVYEVSGREDLLKVLHIAIAFQIRCAFSALPQEFDTVDFVTNTMLAAKSQGLAASRHLLVTLLEGVYVIAEPERNASLTLIAAETSRMINGSEDGPTLVSAHQIIAMCQLGLVYQFANAEARRSVFDAQRRAFWTALAAAGMKEEQN